jgi:pyrroloquinoline quinone biosynthesis protein B
VAISSDGVGWFLINASPDLSTQIESISLVTPGTDSRHMGPVEAVLLTNADLDHTLGLFLLREGGPVTIYATSAVRQTLCESLRVDKILNRFCGVRWGEPGLTSAPLMRRDGSASGLSARVIPLPSEKPSFAESEMIADNGYSVAWQILDDATGKRSLIAPHVSEITEPLRAAMIESDAVLFDGTFWADDELQHLKPSARTARHMGHLPVRESVDVLGALRARHKALVHINNTNPILAPGSPERRHVEGAGIVVGEDGMEFRL